jgi:hypothetical protein
LAERDLDAVVAALTADQRRLIELGTPLLWPPLRGLGAAEILAELRRQGRYAAELAGLAGFPDLAADPAAPWAALALLRTRPVVPARSVRELLGQVRGSAPGDGLGGLGRPGGGDDGVVLGPCVGESAVPVGGGEGEGGQRHGGEDGDGDG